MISLFNTLENTDAVQKRLMRTPEDIAAVFEKFYALPIVNQIRQMLEEHVRLAEELTMAMKDNNMEQAEMLENQLSQNADRLARMLANTNGKYDYEQLMRLMKMHLDLTSKAMMAELKGNHEEAVDLLDENEKNLMELADVLTEGLVQQFYQR